MFAPREMPARNAPSPGAASGRIRMSSPATPPVVAGVSRRTRRGRGSGWPDSGIIGGPRKSSATRGAGSADRPREDCVGRDMFRHFVASSSSSAAASQGRESGAPGTARQTRGGTAGVRSAYFPAMPDGAATAAPSAQAPLPSSSSTDPTLPATVSLEGHQSFHEVEPRHRVPMPFTLEGTPLPPGEPAPSRHTRFSERPPLRPIQVSGRSTSHVLSHNHELQFPMTLSILWDRTPLRTPVIIPHERLLPSIWISSQTVQALGSAHQRQQEKQQRDSAQTLRPVGLLIGRATFSSRTTRGAEDDEAATFLGESRPIVCIDVFDPGKSATEDDASQTGDPVLQPTHDAVADIDGVVMIPVAGGSLAPSTPAASPSWVSRGVGAVVSHVMGLARTCSGGGQGVNIPTSSSFPGAELWQIQCAVATSEEEQLPIRTESTNASLATTTTLQLRMCLPAVSLAFTLIESLPLLQTPLTSMLLHPASCNSDVTTDATTTDALLPTHGLLTLNQVRRAVPILADDAAAIGPQRIPMVGAWIRMPFDVNAVHQVHSRGRGILSASAIYEPASPAMQRLLTDPAVWAACFQYMYNPRIRRATGVGGTADAFLLCVFPEDPLRPGSPRNPIFLECSVVGAASGSVRTGEVAQTASSSDTFLQPGGNSSPRIPVEMFQFTTQCSCTDDEANSSDTAVRPSAGRFESAADTMVSCRFRPLSARDTNAQKELADALDICTVRINSEALPDTQTEQVHRSHVDPVRIQTCGVGPVAATLAAIAVSEDLSECLPTQSEAVTEEKSVDAKDEKSIHAGDEHDQQTEDEEPVLQIRGGDFSVEFENYEAFQSFEDEDDSCSSDAKSEIGDEDTPGKIMWHNGKGTPRTSLDVAGMSTHVKRGVGEDEQLISASSFFNKEERTRGSLSKDQLRQSHELDSPRWLTRMQNKANPSFVQLSVPCSVSSSTSSLHNDAIRTQSKVQSRLEAHSVIAAQQLEIRMLREQVEKLSEMVMKMNQQKQIVGTSAETPVDMKLEKSEQLHRSQDRAGMHAKVNGSASETVENKSREQPGEEKGDYDTGVDVEHSDVVHDESPVNPMIRLSIPSFSEKAQGAVPEDGHGNHSPETEEQLNTGPASASVPETTGNLAGEDEQKSPSQKIQNGMGKHEHMEKSSLVNSYVKIPRIEFDERYLTRGSSDDSEASFFESEDAKGTLDGWHKAGSISSGSCVDEEKEENSTLPFIAADPLLGRGGDLSSFQESDTIARIEAKYLREGERTAVMNGASFASEHRGRRTRKKRRRRKHRRDDRGEESNEHGPAHKTVLDRQRLLNMPKFKR